MTRRQQKNTILAFVAGVLTTFLVVLLGLFLLGLLDGDKIGSTNPSSSLSADVSSSSSVAISSPSTKAPSETGEDTSYSSEPTPVLNMQVDAIANGDYSSVEGRWVDGYGHAIEFSKTGVVGEGSSILVLEMKDRGSLRTNYTPDKTGFILEFFPAGVSATVYLLDQEKDVVDPSDQNRDRLWMGQSLDGVADSAAYFYKE